MWQQQPVLVPVLLQQRWFGLLSAPALASRFPWWLGCGHSTSHPSSQARHCQALWEAPGEGSLCFTACAGHREHFEAVTSRVPWSSALPEASGPACTHLHWELGGHTPALLPLPGAQALERLPRSIHGEHSLSGRVLPAAQGDSGARLPGEESG